ncbi:GH3 family domain-containing protein [Zooshikella harenae]|uniref:GH3 auxin-responsive promoter family protein n=1 Tax=Zooshikella harenae TaxID=2827238 RepID=A0ABS5ZI61_9GAMM|nr:GH3 auxin-responsive promoter family protein [Zooshikella harenae]MBU2713769.1 GH3 auxin-responsive promoter family protein [Zooshikella harenae]
MMLNTSWKNDWSLLKDSFQQDCQFHSNHFKYCLAHPNEVQTTVLEDIIRLGQNSLMWKEENYRLNTVNVDEYRKKIPIKRYADFIPYIEREIDAKGGVLSCSPVMRWLKTSGTTGSAKKVPYTQHWMNHYRVPAIKAMWSTYMHHCPEMLSDPYAVLDMQTVLEEPSEFIKGLAYQSISNRYPRLDKNDWTPPWLNAPWFVSGMPGSHEERMYHRLRFLIGKPLHFISTINPSTLISMWDILLSQQERLINDIHLGTLNGKKLFEPNATLAKQLTSILNTKNISFKDIWPSLSLFSCWVSASAKLYRPLLNKILPGVTQIPFMTCGTEGVVTIPVDESLTSQPLAINQAFYEFVPAEVDMSDVLNPAQSTNTLLFNQLETGKEYHLIMSQANGLYRLATGDIFRVEGFEGNVPRLNFIRRDGIFHSFTGEKLTEDQVTEAISTFSQQNNIDLGLYMCGPKWAHIPRYVLMLETPSDLSVSNDEIAEKIDGCLQKVNIEYASNSTLAIIQYT